MRLDKQMKDKNTKKYVFVVLIGVLAFWLLNNISIITNILSVIFNVLKPFLLGGVIAYILNVPMRKIEKFLSTKIKNNDSLVRVISIICSLLLFVLVLAFVAFLLIPELVENIKMLVSTIPAFIDNVELYILDMLGKYPDVQISIKEMFTESNNLTQVASNLLNYILNGAVGFIGNLLSGFVTFFMALIFSVYMLVQKEYLVKGSKKVICALFSKKHSDYLMNVGKMTNETFSKFISGQCLEAVILGVIMFIVLSIFRFDYALIISVLTAVTALIPIFGAMIAMAVGAILIAITKPVDAVIFVVVFFIVQQIEGNFIYPKVVGKSVGLSPLWTLLAITVGGNLFGIMGMLIGLPLASVVYALFKTHINLKLKEKKIKIK